jgi:hypothetical protein
MKLLLDDQYSLDLAGYFATKAGHDWEKIQDKITDLNFLSEFQEAFWAAIVNFSNPLKKDLLIKIWTLLKKEIKHLKLENEPSSELPSMSSQEE